MFKTRKNILKESKEAVLIQHKYTHAPLHKSKHDE